MRVGAVTGNQHAQAFSGILSYDLNGILHRAGKLYAPVPNSKTFQAYLPLGDGARAGYREGMKSTPLSRRSRQIRFALFFAAFYIGFGAYLPYMPVWYEMRGMSPELIGLAGAAGMIGRIVAAPLGAFWFDRAARRRNPIIVFVLLALILFIAHWPIHSPVLLIVMAGLAGAALTGAIPIVDAFAMHQSRTKGFGFGPARAMGSASFIVGNIGAGVLIGLMGPPVALVWIVSGLALASLSLFLLPPGRRVGSGRKTGNPGGASVLWQSGFLLAFAASAMIQSAHGFYYAFSALAWKSQGIDTGLVGLLWALGVGSEIILLTFATALFKRLSAAQLLAMGAAASILRWGLLALAPPIWVLVPLQGLHALTFGASYLGFIRFASETAPDRFTGTAQAINSALSGGLALALVTALSGLAFAEFGVRGFGFMMIPASLGLACAGLLALKLRSTSVA